MVQVSAFKSILVFNNRNVLGTLMAKHGEISLERGVRKYQLWKKNKNDEYELLKFRLFGGCKQFRYKFKI